MSEFSFTEDQKAAINSGSSMVITACPGSGKTTVVVEKIRNEVECLASFQGVIAITFTVKASKELKQRCKKGAFDTKSSFFGTIDHLCLGEIIFPFLSRFFGPLESTLECKSIFELDEVLSSRIPIFSSSQGSITTGMFSALEEEIKYLYSNGIVLLESLGVLANYILKNSIACQKYLKAKYTSVYVDEYQDSSEPQHALFIQLLDMGLTGVAVGDIQQSIYAWRGSNSDYILQLTRQPEVFEHHIVNKNHRCHPSITNYSNRLFDETCLLLPAPDIRVYQWVYTGTQLDIAEQISFSINDLLEKGLVSSLSEVAILVRNNNSLEMLDQKLTVPFRIFDEDPLAIRNTLVCSVFSELLRYRFDANFHANEVLELIQAKKGISSKDKTTYRRLLKGIKSLCREELAHCIIELAATFLDSELLEVEKQLLLQICLEDKVLKHYKPIDEQEVQVMTLHKSKGLEFEAVYHLDLYDWIFPKREYIPGNFDEVFSDWEQDLNLHFVGVTRAKNYCFLISSTSRINFQHQVKNGNPSQFLSLKGLNGLYNKS